jgi:ABC-type branched-subunit amino acid transport system ATPase component
MGLVPRGAGVSTLSVEENLLVAERNVDRHKWTLERVYALFPACAAAPPRSHAVGRRATDAGDRPRADQPGLPDVDEPSEGSPIIIQGVWEAIGKLKRRAVDPLVEQNALALKRSTTCM